LKNDIKIEITHVKEQINIRLKEQNEYEEFDKELVDFTKFCLRYEDKLTTDWWNMNHEQRLRCQLLLFPGGITLNSEKKLAPKT